MTIFSNRALLLVMTAAVLGAQATEVQDPLKRTTPQSTVLTFLQTCKAKDYARALHYLDLSSVPVQARLDKGSALAQQLDTLLEHNPQFDAAALSSDPTGGHEQGVPPNRERVATFLLNGKSVDMQLERTELRSGAFIWRFAADSVALIPHLAAASSESPLERHVPVFLIELKFLSTPAWIWIALLCLAAGIAVMVTVAGRFIPLMLAPLIQQVAPRVNWNSLLVLIGPLELLVAVAMFRAGMAWIEPPPKLDLYLTRGLSAVSILGLAWLFVAALDLAIARVRVYLNATHPRFSSSVLPLLGRVVKVLALAFGCIAILSSWGYNTNAILAGMGIGGVAIALAAQKTIENLFGGVAVVGDKPVFVGEFCKFGDTVGTVEDIGLRSTRIRTLDRTLVTVPNAQFSSVSLENFSRKDKILFHPTLNLRRDTTPDQVRSVLGSLHKILTEDHRIETGRLPVRFVGVGSYSLDVEVFAYILTGDGDEFLRIQQELLLKILDTIASAGTALALPTQASVSYSSESRELAAR